MIKTLKGLFPYIRPHYKLIWTIIIGMGVGSLIDAAIPLFQNYAIDHFVGEHTLDTLGWFITFYVLLLIFQAIVNAIGCYAANKAEVYVDKDIKQACFDHVQTLSFSYFNQNSVGYIHSRVISDPDRIGAIISWGLLDTVINLAYILGIFVIMLILNPLLGLLLMIVVPIEFAVTMYFQKHLTRENRKVRELNSIITGNYNEGITGARTIKSLVVEDGMTKDFKKDTGAMKYAAIRAGHYRQLFHASIVFFSSVALALVLWEGGMLTRQGLMLVGSLSVFMNYAVAVGAYIQELVGTIANLINTGVNLERIQLLLSEKSTVEDTPEVIEKYGGTFNPKKENWEPLDGDIEFENVTFRYPDGDVNVLENFDLKIPKGSMTAIVGETGAGKSTLVNLVCRFYEPTKGRVLIDGCDARERSQLWLHSHIGYVLQQPHLFSGSIIDNLRYGNENATMEEIRTACERVSADKVIARMKDGYESEVGEGGDLLSTGEKQLISFARALLADPEILVLDEATSSVDTLTEASIQEAIKTVTEGRTSFLIAHRLSTVRDADMILCMKDGKIVERGTHSELLAAKGYYYKLYTQQFTENELSSK